MVLSSLLKAAIWATTQAAVAPVPTVVPFLDLGELREVASKRLFLPRPGAYYDFDDHMVGGGWLFAPPAGGFDAWIRWSGGGPLSLSAVNLTTGQRRQWRLPTRGDAEERAVRELIPEYEDVYYKAWEGAISPWPGGGLLLQGLFGGSRMPVLLELNALSARDRTPLSALGVGPFISSEMFWHRLRGAHGPNRYVGVDARECFYSLTEGASPKLVARLDELRLATGWELEPDSPLVERTSFSHEPILRNGVWYGFTMTTLGDRAAPSSPGSPASYNGPWHQSLLAIDAHSGKRLWAEPLTAEGSFAWTLRQYGIHPWASQSALVAYGSGGSYHYPATSTWSFEVADIQPDGGLVAHKVEVEGPVHSHAEFACEIKPGLALFSWEHDKDDHLDDVRERGWVLVQAPR